MSLSPWLLVGSALILGLAIAFWAVKTARQERDTMTRALLERAGALMWAMEGGARAGMGMQRTAFYLQFMLEETARQPGIAYLAVITRQGDIVAHSDRQRLGEKLLLSDMPDSDVASQINWRVRKAEGGKRIFEAFKLFTPLPGFRENMRHSGGHGPRMRGRMMSGRMHGGMHGGMHMGQLPDSVPEASPPGAFSPPPPLSPSQDNGAGSAPARQGDELAIVVGLDMAAFDSALVTAERNTLFTALLVGLIGVGGFISLFWAQSYRMSRRMLMDATALSDEVINSLPLGLVIFAASGRVAQVNGVAESLLGRPAQAMLGLSPAEMQGLDWAAVAERVRQGESVLEEEHALLSPVEGEAPIPVSLGASHIMNEKGDTLGTLFLLRDLREVKRLQAELRRNERLSTLGNMAARVAHEIRNPLSSIKGFATYLGSRRDNDADREAARTMIGEVERLNRVVSELLDFARPSNLTIAPVPLNDILRRPLRLALTDAEARGVRLTLKEDPAALALHVAVDAERITQALLNLVLNAVQATEAGGSVTLAVLPREARRVGVTVEDTGRGMEAEVLAQVFSPYFTTRATGTGLGLAIVAKIVEDHGGEIAMRSEAGKGTVATLWLPLAEQEFSGGHHA